MLVTELEREKVTGLERGVVPRPAACWSLNSREKVTGLEREVSFLVLLRAGHRIRLDAVAEDATQSIPAAAPQLHGNRQHRPTVQCHKGSEDLPS